jgi:hypothetical protein
MSVARVPKSALVCIIAGITLVPHAVPASAPAGPPPAWVSAYMADMIGVWVADNTPFKSAQELADAYGIEWTWGAGRQSLVGRLYEIRNGKDIGNHWDFREFWHPGENQLLASQFGSDGRFGIGPHTRNADGTMEMLQTFYSPNGPEARVGHRSERRGDELITRSFDVAADGTWTPRRSYTWRRQR